MKKGLLFIVLFLYMLAMYSCVIQEEVIEDDIPVDIIELPYGGRLIVSVPQNSSTPTSGIIILSGGGYGYVGAMDVLKEWKYVMAKNNIALFSVDYTLPNGNPELPVKDVINAYDYITTHWSDFNINPDLVGIMGFSAGGHLASLVSTKYGSKLNLAFQVLIYPVISMESGLTHWPSRINLLGEVSEEDAKEYSTDLLVTENTPPAYIILSDPDEFVHPDNGMRYHQSLINKGIESNICILNKGQHGWQFSDCPDTREIEKMINWIKFIER